MAKDIFPGVLYEVYDQRYANKQATDALAASLPETYSNKTETTAKFNALTAGQSAGTLGFATVAAMNADLAHPVNTPAIVTNDPTPANNTYWIKLGASGSGSWQKSSIPMQAPARGISVSCFGDSFTMGLSGGITYDQAYCSLIAAAKGWALDNQAYGGSQIASGEEIDRILAKIVSNSSIQWIMTGINDTRAYGVAPTGISTYTQTLSAALAWMGLPDGKKIRAIDSAAVKAGAGWAVNSSWYGGISMHTNTEGDSITFTVRGGGIYLCFVRDATSPGKCSITVDGISYGTYDHSGSTGVVQNPRNYSLGFFRISGLTDEVHTVVVTKTSASVAGDYLRVAWAAGVEGAAGDYSENGGPCLYVGNCCRLTAAGYAMDAPTWSNSSDSVVAAYNRIIAKVVRDLASDGLNIVHVNVHGYYDPYTMTSTDGIHPNPAGHQAIASAFLSAMDMFVHPRDRQAIESLKAPKEHVSTGDTPAHSGAVRMSFSDRITKRSSANSGDIDIVKTTEGDGSLGYVTEIGDIENRTCIRGGGSGTELSFNIKLGDDGLQYAINGAQDVYVIAMNGDGIIVNRKAAPGSAPITAWTESYGLRQELPVHSVISVINADGVPTYGTWVLMQTRYISDQVVYDYGRTV